MKRIFGAPVFMVLILVFLAACSPKTSAQPENSSGETAAQNEDVVEQAPEPVEYTVEMSEYAFSPTELTARVGQEVTIKLVNVGALEHELMFGRTVVSDGVGRPNGFEHDMFAESGIEPEVMSMEKDMDGDQTEADEHTEDDDELMDEHKGFMVLVPVGDQSASLTFTITEDMVGEWEMGCFLLDGVHFTSGMKGIFTVKP